LKLVEGLFPLVQLALSGSPKVTLGSPDKVVSAQHAAQQSTVSVAESHAAPAARTESARRTSFSASIANKLPSEAHGLLKVFLYCRSAYMDRASV
jgi:guanyl-specific ribonuclease Sa